MKANLPVLYNPPPRRLRRAGPLPALSKRSSAVMVVVQRQPRLVATRWPVNGEVPSCLATGAICFVAGSVLPLLVGAVLLGLVLNYSSSRVAAANNLPAARPRRLAVLPTLTPTLRPSVQPASAGPVQPPAPGGLPGLSQPFSIEVIERDLEPAPFVELEPESIAEPVHPLIDWPVKGANKQGFGCSPYYTGIPGPGCPAESPWFHDGVDLAAAAGTPVRAVLTGTVIFAGPDGSGPVCRDGYRGYGLAIVSDDGADWQVLYAHLSRVDVTAGQVVTPETVIGAAGETGCVSGPHLHFGLRHNGVLVDPEEVTGLPGKE